MKCKYCNDTIPLKDLQYKEVLFGRQCLYCLNMKDKIKKKIAKQKHKEKQKEREKLFTNMLK